MNEYKLVNPVLLGSFNTVFKGNNPEDAAKEFWTKLTDGNYISGNVPLFLFTLKGVKNNELYHFKLQEEPHGKSADYTIQKVDINLSKSQTDKFLNGVEEVIESSDKIGGSHIGGRSHKKKRRHKKDDSSSSSSSSSDEDDLFKYLRLKSITTPISYWWYTPTIYNISKIFTPTFVAPTSPYVQLWIPVLNN